MLPFLEHVDSSGMSVGGWWPLDWLVRLLLTKQLICQHHFFPEGSQMERATRHRRVARRLAAVRILCVLLVLHACAGSAALRLPAEQEAALCDAISADALAAHSLPPRI